MVPVVRILRDIVGLESVTEEHREGQMPRSLNLVLHRLGGGQVQHHVKELVEHLASFLQWHDRILEYGRVERMGNPEIRKHGFCELVGHHDDLRLDVLGMSDGLIDLSTHHDKQARRLGNIFPHVDFHLRPSFAVDAAHRHIGLEGSADSPDVLL
ncbi:MAG: hypothetical protein ACI4TM_09725 [Candidatus Cryptobacteroides sp.]